MNQKNIWKEYITAQAQVLKHKSKPIGISTDNPPQLEGLKINLSIDQEIFKKEFKKKVENIFNVESFEFESGYIQTSLETSVNITPENLTKLKELSEKCYIEFNENPVVEGLILAKNNLVKDELKKIIGEIPTNYQFKNSGLLLLNLEDWKKANEIKGLRFEPKIGAVFPVKPSLSFIISTFYKTIEISQNGNKIKVIGELQQDIYNLFEEYFGLSKRGNCLIFNFQDAENLNRKLQYLKAKGISLPEPKDKTLLFYYDNTFFETNESDLGFEAFRLKKILNRYFPDNLFEVSYSTDYTFDDRKFDKGIEDLEWNENVFWDRLLNEIHGNNFQISQTHRTVSFDFESEEDLNQKLSFVKSFSFFDIYDRGEKHKFKFNIKFESGLHQLQAEIKKIIPNLNTKLISNGEKLIFRHFYQAGNKTEVLSRLKNKLNDFFNESEIFSYVINDTFQEKYLCEENFEFKVEQEEEKLSKLLRVDFYFGSPGEKYYLGKLQKVDYPNLYFNVDEDRLHEVEENINKEIIRSIFPDLKGEKDKIKRLNDTLFKLEDEKIKLPNDNAKVFLFDSSKAKSIGNLDNLLNNESVEYQEFEINLFSKTLNKSQKEAIFKSLHAEELALIQGPPGTGKSTAIAEIIWQHIRKAQNEKNQTKILLTSETNLAVDNAIDRLKNKQNNIVKPIRFGNSENLESEGYFYSLEAIKTWEKSTSSHGNTVAHWINNIVNRITIHEDERIDTALNKWKTHLQNPSSETKKIFVAKYLEYVNLIGATGSSIGKLNSENKWTSFFRSYLSVFEDANYKILSEKSQLIKALEIDNDTFEDEIKKTKWEFSTLKSQLDQVEISFDTVIIDEASKATPPELALPVLHGKKSIIVGDHRQLPPMIDGEEIKDLLISIGEKELAVTLSKKEFEISQFERLFTHIDESIKGTFDTQYRMHPAINKVISEFYKNDSEKGLQCGLPLDEIYHNSFDKWDSRYHGLNFKNLITPETHTIWINVSTPEIQEGTSRVNFGEIEAIDNILTVLKNSDGKTELDKWLDNQSQEEKQIGLISFYGKQISYLERMLLQSHNDLYKGKGKDNDKRNLVRLSTVDRFQGMERNIIIVSMVRSNKIAPSQHQLPNYELYGEIGYQNQESLGFAESPNRLNVALSRARRLLIVVGNSDHFCRKDIYKNVFETIQQNGKIISAEELQNVVEQNG